MKRTLVLLVLALAWSSTHAAFNVSRNDNVVVYWGQNSAGIHYSSDPSKWEGPLRSFCQDNSIDAIEVAFLNIFFDTTSTRQLPAINLANHCSATFASSGLPGLLDCPTVGSDITYCQSQGKAILLSLGGAAGVYGFTSSTQAQTFAVTVWNMFLGGSDPSYPRPFGSAVMDGVDLDIEGGGTLYYGDFITKLRQLWSGAGKRYYISSAPQCPFPDAYVGPNANSRTGTAISTWMDWINIQFYNNYCGVSAYGTSNFNYQTWATWLASASNPNPNMKIFLGVPAASYSGGGYVSQTELQTIVSSLRSNPSFGGVMMWDAGSALQNNNYAGQISAFMKGTSTPTTAPTSVPPSTPSPSATSAPSSTPSPSSTSTPSSTPSPTSTSAPTSTPTSAPTSAPPSTTPSCPSGYSGNKCVTECGTQWYQCASGIIYPPQNTAPGTVCSNGQLVYPYQCTVPSAAPSSSSPTSSPSTSPSSSPSSSPSPSTTSAPTSPPPTPAPTSASDQGNSAHPPRSCSTDGLYCWPGNCCTQFYQCSAGIVYPLQAVATGTLCYNSQLVLTSDPNCANVNCGNGSASLVPSPAPTCGNKKCESGETCSNCPTDCGACPPSCGDGKCNGAETCATCVVDCGPCSGPTATPLPTTSATSVPTSASTSLPGPSPTTPPTTSSNGKKLIGYYTNWAQYRPGAGKFFPEQIDATLFTHILYAFAKIDSSYNVQPFEWNDIISWNPPTGMYNRFNTHVRSQNPTVKTSISIGGWNFNALPATASIFTTICQTAQYRQVFINSAIQFARTNGFDGVDIDWEYPGDASQGGRTGDKQCFTTLLQEFRQAIINEAVASNKAPLLLSIAVSAGAPIISNAYEISSIGQYVDWVGLMSYDLHGSWESQTGAQTALYSTTSSLSVDGAVQIWLNGGLPANKLVIGLAAYGRTWTLSTSNTGMGAPASGAGKAGPYTDEAGFLAYYEIIAETGATSVYDPASHTMYAYWGNQWVSYDDESTLIEKVDYLSSKNLAGGMFWAIDLDDFSHGYPLISTVAQRIFVPSSQHMTLVVASSTTSFDSNSLKIAIARATGLPVDSIAVGAVESNGSNSVTVTVSFVNSFSTSQSASQQYSSFAAVACNTSGVTSVNGQTCTSPTSSTTPGNNSAASTMAPILALISLTVVAAVFVVLA